MLGQLVQLGRVEHLEQIDVPQRRDQVLDVRVMLVGLGQRVDLVHIHLADREWQLDAGAVQMIPGAGHHRIALFGVLVIIIEPEFDIVGHAIVAILDQLDRRGRLAADIGRCQRGLGQYLLDQVGRVAVAEPDLDVHGLDW